MGITTTTTTTTTTNGSVLNTINISFQAVSPDLVRVRLEGPRAIGMYRLLLTYRDSFATLRSNYYAMIEQDRWLAYSYRDLAGATTRALTRAMDWAKYHDFTLAQVSHIFEAIDKGMTIAVSVNDERMPSLESCRVPTLGPGN